jgi:hypothetical protein
MNSISEVGVSGHLEGGRFIPNNSSSNPAAGAEHSIAVTAGKIWQLVGLTAALVTSATAGLRNPRLIYDDGSTNGAPTIPGSFGTQNINITETYSWAQDMAQGSSVSVTPATLSNAPIPANLYFFGGYNIKTSTANLQVDDDWGVATYSIIQFDQD